MRTASFVPGGFALIPVVHMELRLMALFEKDFMMALSWQRCFQDAHSANTSPFPFECILTRKPGRSVRELESDLRSPVDRTCVQAVCLPFGVKSHSPRTLREYHYLHHPDSPNG
jgi:hypothetical protein